MSSINISLPADQVSQVDNFVANFGFANRSEFIRSLLRLANRHPQLVETATAFPFIAPEEKSINKVVAEFAKSGKYTAGFLKDLKKGLEASDYFKE